MTVKKCKACGRALSNNAVKCSYCGALVTKRKFPLSSLVVLIICAYLIVQYFDDLKMFLLDDSVDQVKNEVAIDIVWNSGASDNIMMADIIIINKSQEMIEDLNITCTHYDDNAARVSGKSLTVYEAIAANEQSTVSDFNMGFNDERIRQTECEITDLELIK